MRDIINQFDDRQVRALLGDAIGLAAVCVIVLVALSFPASL